MQKLLTHAVTKWKPEQTPNLGKVHLWMVVAGKAMPMIALLGEGQTWRSFFPSLIKSWLIPYPGGRESVHQQYPIARAKIKVYQLAETDIEALLEPLLKLPLNLRVYAINRLSSQ